MNANQIRALKYLPTGQNLSGDVGNKIPTCGVVVISNPLVRDVCVFYAGRYKSIEVDHRKLIDYSILLNNTR